ncbi:antibiotic biosynthesis monooxygenase [bacterium]|nr:antibiotic biosynthesis monooxygenase [bacterium]
MIVASITVYVKPEHIDDFIQATIANHQDSIQEPGNLRFDVLQCQDDSTRFLLYEAYDSESSAAAHKKTGHYLKWRETVEPWMAKPRTGILHTVIAPDKREQW